MAGIPGFPNNPMLLGRGEIFPAYYFGLTPGGKDNTASIQNDLIPFLATRGGRVHFEPGIYAIPPFDAMGGLPEFSTLFGSGVGSTILQVEPGSNYNYALYNHQSQGANDPYGRCISLMNLTIDGNNSNQTGGLGWGAYFNTPTPGGALAVDYAVDQHNVLINVQILNAYGNGVGGNGSGSVDLYEVWVKNPNGHAFQLPYDSGAFHCISEGAGLNGFQLIAGSTHYVGCKAFYSGRLNVTNAQNGYAFFISDSGDTGRLSLIACEAQDNGAGAVYCYNTRWVTAIDFVADSNGWGNGSGLVAPGTYPALDFYDAWYCSFRNFMSYDRQVNHGAGARVTQSNAVRLGGSTVRGFINVEGFHKGMATNGSGDAAMSTPIMSWDTVNCTNSNVTMNNLTTSH